MNQPVIGLIDYGAGNLHSVEKAVRYLGLSTVRVKHPEDLHRVQRLILPGVGAFGAACQRLYQTGLIEPLLDWIDDGRPLLGICLGLQLLLESSEESPESKGLGVFKGTCKKFSAPRVPQIGWNRIFIVQEHPVFENIEDGTYFYFLHSYYACPQDPDVVIAETEYSIRYASVIARGNLTATQFHPEKSGPQGLQLLRNWCMLPEHALLHFRS